MFDSGDQLETITAAQTPALFNADNGNPAEFDTRSDNKGPEPEAVTVGVIDGRTYAFVGSERAGGGVFVYDVTDPQASRFIQYVRMDGDVAPESLSFIAAASSPSGRPLLVVANEVSHTATVYEIANPAPVVVKLVLGETVFDDGQRDQLWGESGDDWFLAFAGDAVKDRRPGDC